MLLQFRCSKLTEYGLGHPAAMYFAETKKYATLYIC